MPAIIQSEVKTIIAGHIFNQLESQSGEKSNTLVWNAPNGEAITITADQLMAALNEAFYKLF